MFDGQTSLGWTAYEQDLDGVDGPSPFSGPVTVLLGNVDGGDYDFAMVLVDTPMINTTDLILV